MMRIRSTLTAMCSSEEGIEDGCCQDEFLHADIEVNEGVHGGYTHVGRGI
jgi:hypothetical protein